MTAGIQHQLKKQSLPGQYPRASCNREKAATSAVEAFGRPRDVPLRRWLSNAISVFILMLKIIKRLSAD